MTGNGLTAHDTTAETQAFLSWVDCDALQSPETWRRLHTIVRVRPEKDLFPVRAKYDGKSDTIGLNYLTINGSLWFTLADCVAAKLLSGKAPIVEEAITFRPGPPQEDLQPIDLFGDADYRVDPSKDDVFKRLVDLRDQAKSNGDPNERAIKIIANATSYGIFIEIQRDDAPKAERIDVYGPDGSKVETTSKALEEPGRYFNPILGVLITGAARLMLALAERLVLDAGLDWVFCDTDSLAIAKPDGMDEATFLKQSKAVVDWFAPLNPYEKPGSILKIEDTNFAIGSRETIEPLYAFAISAKRYVLFNLDQNGNPIIRNASAHGLGHLIAPYAEDDAPAEIPPPQMPLADIGVDRWQYDLWYKIIEATLNGHPDRASLDYHPSFANPAASRYGATSPRLHKWFKRWNLPLDYAEQVKPFNFLLSFQARNGMWGDFKSSKLAQLPGPGRPKKIRDVAPVAAYDRDPAMAAEQAFDRESGDPVANEQLKTYADCLAQYHLSPESKFASGDYCNSGRTERRHVVAKSIRLIGKEGNRVEEEGLGEDDGLLEIYRQADALGFQ